MAQCKNCLHYQVCAWCVDANNCSFFKPKSELPDDHHKQVACYTLGCREGDKIKREVAREIFEEIESISSDFPIYGNVNTVILSERDLAFIKKKYTEDKNHEN